VRPIVAGLVACSVVVGSYRDAAARTEWVVLRVERVEVAVAHADGSPWDDVGGDGLRCGAGSEDLLSSAHWGPIVKRFCSSSGNAPGNPDLQLRLSVGGVTEYLSAIAEDALAHDFHYEFLVPRDAAPTIDVFDQDGIDPGRGEPLGSIQMTRRDVENLLAGSSRIKTFSNDSVVRLEMTARPYRRAARRSVEIAGRKRVARFASAVIAGELIEVRSSGGSATPTIVIGDGLTRLRIGQCTRAVVANSGPIAAGLDDADPPAAARFELRVLPPSLTRWTTSAGWTPCDGRHVEARSIVALRQLQTLSGTTLTAAAVEKIVRSRYLLGIARCHERQLRTDRLAIGQMRVRFTVGPTAGVVKADATGLAPSLEACVEALVLRWRFGAPKDTNGNPTSVDVAAALRLDAK